MSQQHTLRRDVRRYALGDSSAAAAVLDSRVTDWSNRVVANGAAAPSALTQLVLSTFVQSLTSSALLPKMITINCMVPDSLIACLTPFLRGPGNDLWVEHNLVSGDLTVTGLKGNGSNKYADLGLDLTLLSATGNGNPLSDLGLTLYMPDLTSAVGTYVEAGVFSTSNSNNDFYLLPNINGTLFWTTGGTSAGDVSTTAPNLNGYYSGNRISASDNRIFFANSVNAHAQVGSTASGASNGPISANMYILAGHNTALGGAADFVNRTISFFALHHGLTSAQSATFFNVVQSMRVGLGGGFA